jgi:hypothetical protein
MIAVICFFSLDFSRNASLCDFLYAWITGNSPLDRVVFVFPVTVEVMFSWAVELHERQRSAKCLHVHVFNQPLDSPPRQTQDQDLTLPLPLEGYLAKQQQQNNNIPPTMTRAQQTITAFVLMATVSLTTLLPCADSCPY